MSPITELIGSAKAYGWGSLVASTAFESIASATGTGSNTSITFSSIPSTYQDLQIRYSALPVSGSGTVQVRMRVNNDSGANYTKHLLYGDGDGSSAISSGATGQDYSAELPVSSMNTTAPLVAVIDIINYASTSKNKTIKTLGGIDRNGSGSINLVSNLWTNTSAINRLDFYISTGTAFATGSTIALYGIKGA